MNEEEKKHIIKMQKMIIKQEPKGTQRSFIDNGLLQIIEKQQKEIEELSAKLTTKICKGVEEEVLEEYRQKINNQQKEIEKLKREVKTLGEELGYE